MHSFKFQFNWLHAYLSLIENIDEVTFFDVQQLCDHPIAWRVALDIFAFEPREMVKISKGKYLGFVTYS